MSEKGQQNEKSGYLPHPVVWTDEQISNLWSYYSGNKAYQKQYFSYQAGEIILNQIEKYVPFSEISTVLDYGCGPGFLLEKLMNRLKVPQKCYGLDFSKESICLVENRCTGKQNYGKSMWAEELPSPYEDESMDLVIALEVMEHLNDTQLSHTGHEIYRLLKPQGHVSITTPNRENLDESKTICPECGAVFHRWQHVRTWTAASLTKYMEHIGFKTVAVLESNFASKFQNLLKYFLKRFPEKRTHLLYIGMK